MLPDALPQLMETLLRLPHLEAAQLRELIQHLPDPQAAAQEMVRRGWITQPQFWSLFPDPQQRPTPRETMLVGIGHDDAPLDSDCDWELPLGDEEDKAPEVGAAPPEVVALCTPQFERDAPAPAVAGGIEPRRRESDTDHLSRQWMVWACIGLLMCAMFLGSYFAALQFFVEHFTVPPVARQEPKKAVAGDPAKAVDLPSKPSIAAAVPPITAPSAAAPPAAVPQAAPVAAAAPVKAKPPAEKNAKPQAPASLYERVRQVVLENKTEETERLGMGDLAYQDVSDDGSIMVGMEVTYAPFFTHNVIKSVRPIYQRADGRRYDGAVCGDPKGVGERVVAAPGYAIGGAAIRSGMGIDGVQLTFMEIGADGLNPNKKYLSKWLGGYGGADAKTFVNDGRPIVGIAGMRSKLNFGPAFCMCLVTTKAGALADASRTLIAPVRQVLYIVPPQQREPAR